MTDLLVVERLRIRTRAGTPVRDVSLRVAEGERVALLGESGSGKSLTAAAIIGLSGPGTTIAGGAVRWRGRDLLALSAEELRRVRGGEIGFMWQDPGASLDPVLRVGAQIVESMRAHADRSAGAAGAQAMALLARIGLADPARAMRSHPHELSGGMRQRAALALAVACQPRLLVADEPTTAVDAVNQARMLDLVTTSCETTGMALLWITHDPAVAAVIATRGAVMHAGQVVEEAPMRALLDVPLHPYTQALVGSVRWSPRAAPGAGAASSQPERGCRYRPRCPRAEARCAEEEPALRAVDADRSAACWVV